MSTVSFLAYAYRMLSFDLILVALSQELKDIF